MSGSSQSQQGFQALKYPGNDNQWYSASKPVPPDRARMREALA